MKQYRLAAAVALVGLVLSGCDSTPKVELESPAQKASYGIGLNMGKSLAQEGIDDLDPKAVALGIEDAVGKKDQKLTDQQLITTASGLQYEVVKKADGPQPKPTDVVTVHYEGKLVDGTVFDSSIKRGTPIDLPVNGVIPGWVEALQLMHVGEKIKLYIPSELAYGAQSPSPAIPANSVLVFDLELLGIKDAAAADAEDAPAAPAAEAPAAAEKAPAKK